ncbi:MAG: hypothetical protein LUD55_05430, partial [Oscillospiraceae bacterium]|nr:hypothetical protein [Oscillospiraceae bacterium]
MYIYYDSTAAAKSQLSFRHKIQRRRAQFLFNNAQKRTNCWRCSGSLYGVGGLERCAHSVGYAPAVYCV